MKWSYPVFILFAFLLPSVFLIFWTKNFKKENQGDNILILKLFAVGFCSVPVAALVEILTLWLCNLMPAPFVNPMRAFLGVAYVEELVKFGAIIFVLRNRVFQRTKDGMLCGIAVAMGFALMENILYAVGSHSLFRITLLRSFTSFPLHLLSGAVLGLFWLISKRKGKGGGFLGLFIATVLHGTYNLILMGTGEIFVIPFLIGSWCVFAFFYWKKINP